MISSSVMEWDQQQQKVPEDDAMSVSSAESSASSSSGTMDSSISSLSNTKATTASAAVDALVIASLIPTLKTKSIDEFDNIPSICLTGRQYDANTAVLTKTIAEMVRPYIPRRFRIAQKWDLLYSLDQHGVSLGTLYFRMKDFEGPCILTIKDAKEQIFGAYLSHPFSSQSHYYGTGECFLWKLNQQQEQQPKIKVFPWTGKNNYMMLSCSDFIAIGGGDGKFGLWLDSKFDKGYSTTCPTFDNESLALQSEFQCMEMEIWGLCI
ncbi:TLD-domain-containing protein [Parasitella parasitica]|nr:TLD-domain-containing protein [Parasitella parasitica]